MGVVAGLRVRVARGEEGEEHVHEEHARCAARRIVLVHAGLVLCMCNCCNMSVQVVGSLVRGGRGRSRAVERVSVTLRVRSCAAHRVVAVRARVLGAACGSRAAGSHLHSSLHRGFFIMIQYLVVTDR